MGEGGRGWQKVGEGGRRWEKVGEGGKRWEKLREGERRREKAREGERRREKVGEGGRRREKVGERGHLREPILLERERAQVAQLAQRRERVRVAHELVLVHAQLGEHAEVAADGDGERLEHVVGLAAQAGARRVERLERRVATARDDGGDALGAEGIVLEIEVEKLPVGEEQRADHVPRHLAQPPVGDVERRVGARSAAQQRDGQREAVHLDRCELRVVSHRRGDALHSVSADVRIVREVERLERLVLLERDRKVGGGLVIEVGASQVEAQQRRVELDDAREQQDDRVDLALRRRPARGGGFGGFGGRVREHELLEAWRHLEGGRRRWKA